MLDLTNLLRRSSVQGPVEPPSPLSDAQTVVQSPVSYGLIQSINDHVSDELLKIKTEFFKTAITVPHISFLHGKNVEFAEDFVHFPFGLPDPENENLVDMHKEFLEDFLEENSDQIIARADGRVGVYYCHNSDRSCKVKGYCFHDVRKIIYLISKFIQCVFLYV